MPTATLYALLTPATLDTASYVYVKTPSEVQQGRYNVEHVASGRWSDLGLHDTARSRELRVVSEEEAISGIGTYVGSALCVARVSHGQLKVWDYDMVVGYTWTNAAQSCVLQVTFADSTVWRRWAAGLGPGNLRTSIMHTPTELGWPLAGAHPPSSGKWEAARPTCVAVLNSLFVAVPEGTIVETSRHGNSSAEVDRLEQLYDSADDLGEELEESGETPESKRTKRGREETGDPPSAKGESRLLALRKRLEDDPPVVRDIDQFMALS
ncbi:hypothetical protein C6341_g10261 [Phytophthora cactorum]|nr:hypothetical protein C6341_g10261 [Phytophthora cactorum]